MSRQSPTKANDQVRPRYLRWLIALLVAVVLVTSACGSSGPSPVSSAEAVASSAALDAPEEDETTSDEDVPGSEEFGLTMQGLAIRVEQVEASIGACMSAAGFEYIPVDFDTIRQAQAADGTLPGVDDDDFLAQYGFGLTTLPDQPNAMIEIAKGKNAAIVSALSETDQVAYTRTLLGENEDASFIFGLEDEDFSETGGCTREAVEANFSAEEISGTYVNPGDTVIDSDPRMVAALAAWSSCVAENGYDYDTPDDLEDDLVDRLEAILGDQEAAELAGSALDALSELQGFERAIAPVSEDCEDEHIGPAEEQIEIELYGAGQG